MTRPLAFALGCLTGALLVLAVLAVLAGLREDDRPDRGWVE